LADAGIQARYETDACIIQPDLGQGFILKISGPVTKDQVQIVKTVIEDYFRENNIDAYEWVKIVPEREGGGGELVSLNIVKQTEAIKIGSKKDSYVQLSHFEVDGIAFDYPSVLTIPDKTKFDVEKVREMMRPSGVEILNIVMSADMNTTIQVARTKRDTSIDALYEEKNSLAYEINKGGVNVMGYQYTKFTVDKTQLSGNVQALSEYGEKANGEVALALEFLNEGYDYTLMFIYKNRSHMQSGAKDREKVVQSVKIKSKE